MDLTQKVINGILEKHNLTPDDLINYKYCGGNSSNHYNYFLLYFGKNKEFPIVETKCVCKTPIKQNCYITNDIDIIVIGNCCIKKFVKNCKRTCNECGEFHQNNKINKCNNCKEIYKIKNKNHKCKICHCSLKYFNENNYCDNCMKNSCITCGNYSGLYNLCNHCYNNKKCIICGINSNKYDKCLSCKNNEIKIYFDVKFIDKDCFKELEGKFDKYLKKWYIYNNNKHFEFIKNNWNIINI